MTCPRYSDPIKKGGAGAVSGMGVAEVVHGNALDLPIPDGTVDLVVTSLVAKALGRRGIGVDLSRDYCRLAEWRTNDPGELARAMQVEKPPAVDDQQGDLLEMLA